MLPFIMVLVALLLPSGLLGTGFAGTGAARGPAVPGAVSSEVPEQGPAAEKDEDRAMSAEVQVSGKKTADVVFLGDLSGPVGFWNAPRLVGIQDALNYMNEEMGGIAGRQIRLHWVDHKSDVALAEKGYRELKQKNALVWHTCGTGEQQLLKPLYEKDQSQVIFTCSTSPGVIYPVGIVFGTAPYYPDQFGAFIDWLVETSDIKQTGRLPKIAIVTYNSGYGRAIITRESLDYAKSKGIEIVDTIYTPFVTTDPLTPLLKAKKAGADWVFSQWLWQSVPPYLIANKKNRLGLKFCITSFGVDRVMIEKGGEAAEGLTGITSWYLPDEDTPGIRLVNRIIREKARRPEDRGASYFLGWMNMFQTKMALEQTLQRVQSWEKITPREIIATLEKWSDVDVHGLGRLSYSPVGRGADIVRVVQVKSGKWTAVTDWRKCPNLVPRAWMQAPGLAAGRQQRPCH